MQYNLEMHEVFSCSQSAQQVFDYIVDFSHINEWDHTIVTSNKVGDSAIGLGSRFDLVFSMGRRKSPISYEITEFASPSKAELTGTSKSFTAIDTVQIEQQEHGCLVNWHAKIVFTGLSAFIVPFLASKIKAGGAQTIRDLNAILDSQVALPNRA
jgi:hypothetical protein